MNWFCLKTAPQKEFTVERILRENGFEIFMPLEYRWRKIRHRTKKREQIARPKLRPYLFLRMPFAGPAVSLTGILMERARVAYLGDEGVPRAIPESDMKFVFDMHEEPRLMRQRKGREKFNTNHHFRIDEKVTITEGLFEGEVAEISEIRGKNAVIIRELFGVPREILVDFDKLEPAPSEEKKRAA